MKHNYQSYLFNFSCSYFGGGLKRIMAYLKWFNEHGGANFVLNYRLKGIEKTFAVNRYCFLRQSSMARVLNHSAKLNQFITGMNKLDFYYSYGIPLPYKTAGVNWLHLANVLTLMNAKHYVSLKRAWELRLLGFLIRKSIKHADIISAESNASLSLFDSGLKEKLVLSVNGSDEEIAGFKSNLETEQIQNIAVTVGTCQYKCIEDVYKIYLHLRKDNPELVLVIAGIKKDVPKAIQKDKQVILQGVLSQLQVCDLLKKARYYITATLIENSYNAASEGAFFANESFVSDIGPHRELFLNANYQVIDNLDTKLASLHVKRSDLSTNNLKSWDQVICDMINKAQYHLNKKFFHDEISHL